jgi:hypothetical protein
MFFPKLWIAAIGFTGSFPAYYTEDGPPAPSYLSDGVIVQNGQLFLDTTNEDLYICFDNSDQNALVWRVVPRTDQVPASQAQSDWTQTNAGSPGYILNKFPARSQTPALRNLNVGFQVNATRDALVNYSIDILCVLSLTAGETGTLFLEIASDPDFNTNLQELARFVNGNAGTLSIGLNLTQNCTGTVSGFVPAGYYVRLRTFNLIGSPTFAYRSGQEILL